VTLIQAMEPDLPAARDDDDEPTAAALARRMGELGAGAAAYALLRLGRDEVEWASAHPRNEAIEMLALLAPVAARVGGTTLVDETFGAVERVLHWWP
jgi:hypothetical protein